MIEQTKTEKPSLLSLITRKATYREIKAALDAGADVNERDAVMRNTPLHNAVMYSHYGITRLLLQYEVDVNKKNDRGSSPIQLAEDTRILKLLLTHGADANITNNKGNTALHKAVMKSEKDIAQTLLKYGACVNCKNIEGRTPLMMAKDVGLVKLLLSRGANIHEKDKCGCTALMYAARGCLYDVIQILLKSGARITDRDDQGRTVLMHMLRGGSSGPYYIAWLIKKGVDVAAQNHQGLTALDYCRIYDFSPMETGQIVEAMEKMKVIKPLLSMYDDKLHRPITYDELHQALKEGADADRILHKAIDHSGQEKGCLAIEYATDLEIRDSSGRTPLFWAVICNKRKIVHLLLKKGVDVNSRDIDGNTPLMWVRDRRMAAWLCSFGADVHLRNDTGCTALMNAAEFFHIDVMDFLINVGANVGECDYQGRTILMRILTHCSYDNIDRIVKTIRFLLSKGAKTSVRDHRGYTVFDYAQVFATSQAIKDVFYENMEVK